MLRQLLGALALVAIACVGEGSAYVRGTVTEADAVGFSTDETANPVGNFPVVGARLRLFADSDGKPCAELEDAQGTTVTDEDGVFKVPEAVFGGCLFDGDVRHTLCVDHPDYEPFEITDSDDHIWDGSRHVNITLVKRAP